MDGQKIKNHKLGTKSLGRCHANFRPRIGINGRIRFSINGAPPAITNGDHLGSFFLGFSQGSNRIGCFSRLRRHHQKIFFAIHLGLTLKTLTPEKAAPYVQDLVRLSSTLEERLKKKTPKKTRDDEHT